VNLQASTEKHEHNAELATATYHEVLDFSQGQGYDNQVENDVDASRHPRVGIKIEAFPFVLVIPAGPGEADREALKRSCCDERDHV
jgi:hypothetical protein